MTDSRAGRVSWADGPALVLFAMLIAVVLLQFLTRYVLNDSLAWTEEIARYLLIGVAYAGSVTALRKGGHIFLELVYRLAPRNNVKPLALLADGIVVIYHAALTVFAARLTLLADRRMISIDLPKSVVYGFVALSLLVATLFALRQIFRRARQGTDEILAAIEQAAVGEETQC